MEETVFYCEEVHEQVALYLTAHGCRVQVERQPPDYVFHRVSCPVQGWVRCGGGDNSPIYRYYLRDGATFLEQTLRGRGSVPGHSNAYWSSLHIEQHDKDEKNTTHTSASVTRPPILAPPQIWSQASSRPE